MAEKDKKPAFKLPKFLRLGKGSMWFDIDGENSSGVKLYSFNEVFVGRGKLEVVKDKKTGKEKYTEQKEPVKDKFDNQNLVTYGYVEKQLPWYVEVSGIPAEKLSRVIVAFKNGVLVEADPDKPPQPVQKEVKKDFKVGKQGEHVFVGKNKEMYRKLMNFKSSEIRKFIADCPRSEDTRSNLLDMLDYERRGFNSLSRPRSEVLDLINSRLKEFGPGMSAIRKNDLE